MTNRSQQFQKIIEGYNKKLFKDGLNETDNIKLSFAEARLQERQHGLIEELNFLEDWGCNVETDMSKKDILNRIKERIKQIKSELKEK